MKISQKLKTFFKNHKLLFTGMALYIFVYILNYLLPPFMDYSEYSEKSGWIKSFMIEKAREGSVSTYMHNMNVSNGLTDMLPDDFLYFGVADIINAVGYGLFASLAFIMYAECLLRKYLKKIYGSSPVPLKKPEIFIIEYMFSNIMFYPLSIIMKHADPLLMKYPDFIGEKLTDGLKDMSLPIRILGTAGFAAAMIIAAVLVIIPAFAENIGFFIYIIGFSLGGRLIVLIDSKLSSSIGDSSSVKEIIVFAVYLFVIFGLNLVFQLSSEKLHGMWFNLIKNAGKKIKNFKFRKKESGS